MLSIILGSVESSTDSIFFIVLPMKYSPIQTNTALNWFYASFKWATLSIPNEHFPVKNCVDVNLRGQERHQSQLGVTSMF